jgi:hypothetical protein
MTPNSTESTSPRWPCYLKTKVKTEVAQFCAFFRNYRSQHQFRQSPRRQTLYRTSHVPRNSPSSMRQLRSALWLTHLPVVRSLLLRHAVEAGSTFSGTLCTTTTEMWGWSYTIDITIFISHINAGSTFTTQQEFQSSIHQLFDNCS